LLANRDSNYPDIQYILVLNFNGSCVAQVKDGSKQEFRLREEILFEFVVKYDKEHK
jgi:hypothetical protein